MEERIDFAEQDAIDEVLAAHAGDPYDVVETALAAALNVRGIDVPAQWLSAAASTISVGHRYVVNVETALETD